LEKAGYIFLPLADSKMAPGSVIEVKADKSGETNVRYLADIRKCGLTNSDLGFKSGTTGALATNRKYSVDLSAAFEILQIAASAKPKLLAAKTVEFKADETGTDAIDLIATTIAIADPDKSKNFNKFCRDFLSQPDIYLVNEAFRVSKGSYSFKDSAGLTIDLTALKSQNFSANGNLSIANDSSITISTDEYLAIKDVRQIGSGAFRTLGANMNTPVPSADLLLKSGNIKIEN
jgi:hypothetical protein